MFFLNSARIQGPTHNPGLSSESRKSRRGQYEVLWNMVEFSPQIRETTTSITLLESLREGRQPAWRVFFERYGAMLFSFARRLDLSESDAQDAVQETLIAVHAEFSRLDAPFDRQKGRFKAWLRGIAKHKVADIHRRRATLRNREGGQGSEECDFPVGDSSADELFEKEWRDARLTAALDIIAREADPAVFQAFQLYALEGQDPGHVAKLLGISRNAVYIAKTRLIKQLRAIVARLEAEEG